MVASFTVVSGMRVSSPTASTCTSTSTGAVTGARFCSWTTTGAAAPTEPVQLTAVPHTIPSASGSAGRAVPPASAACPASTASATAVASATCCSTQVETPSASMRRSPAVVCTVATTGPRTAIIARPAPPSIRPNDGVLANPSAASASSVSGNPEATAGASFRRADASCASTTSARVPAATTAQSPVVVCCTSNTSVKPTLSAACLRESGCLPACLS